MKHMTLAASVTALLAIGAGVAIGGLPNEAPNRLVVTDAPSTSTSTVVPTPTSSVPSDAAPSTTSDPTVPPTTEPAASITITTQPPVESDESSSDSPTETEVDDPDPDTGDEMQPRSGFSVAAANSAAADGIATDAAGRLNDIGYVDVQAVNTADRGGISRVYFQPGLELSASRLATDLGWSPIEIAPIGEMPTLLTDGDFDLVAVIGQDNVEP